MKAISAVYTLWTRTLRDMHAIFLWTGLEPVTLAQHNQKRGVSAVTCCFQAKDAKNIPMVCWYSNWILLPVPIGIEAMTLHRDTIWKAGRPGMKQFCLRHKNVPAVDANKCWHIRERCGRQGLMSVYLSMKGFKKVTQPFKNPPITWPIFNHNLVWMKETIQE